MKVNYRRSVDQMLITPKAKLPLIENKSDYSLPSITSLESTVLLRIREAFYCNAITLRDNSAFAILKVNDPFVVDIKQ